MAYPPSSENQKNHYLIQIILRIFALVTTLVAASLMLTNHQTVFTYGMEIEARYSNTPAFKFFAIAHLIALALSLLTLVFVFIMGRKAVYPTNYFLLFLHDLIVTCLLVGAFSSAAAIGYAGKYGNVHLGWMPACEHFGKYCRRTTASLVLGFLGMLMYLILTVVSAKQSRQLIDPN